MTGANRACLALRSSDSTKAWLEAIESHSMILSDFQSLEAEIVLGTYDETSVLSHARPPNIPKRLPGIPSVPERFRITVLYILLR